MSLPPIKMIATDIDGTMLRGDSSLSPRVRAALHAAGEAGIHVVPATGRPLMVADEIIADLGLRDYWVFANGAITKHVARDEVIRAFWLEVDLARPLVERVRRAIPGVGLAIEFERGVAYESGFVERVPRVPDVPEVDDVLVGFDPDWALGRVQKLLLFHDRFGVDELYRRAGTALAGDAVATYSGLDFIEVSAGLTTKAVALDALCEDLGISPAEVAAFGDNHNDVTMLSWAGRAYAMGNASADALAVADEVIPTADEDGLAVKIEELLATLI